MAYNTRFKRRQFEDWKVGCGIRVRFENIGYVAEVIMKRMDILKKIYRRRGLFGTALVFVLGPIFSVLYGIAWCCEKTADFLYDISKI